MTSRQAVRVLLLDEADRVLLVRFWDGDHAWWCAPGGGVEPNETDEAAAFDQSERIFLGRAAAFEPRPSPAALLESERHAVVDGGTTCDGRCQVSPRRLPALVRQLLQDGPPSSPVDVGV